MFDVSSISAKAVVTNMCVKLGNIYIFYFGIHTVSKTSSETVLRFVFTKC